MRAVHRVRHAARGINGERAVAARRGPLFLEDSVYSRRLVF